MTTIILHPAAETTTATAQTSAGGGGNKSELQLVAIPASPLKHSSYLSVSDVVEGDELQDRRAKVVMDGVSGCGMSLAGVYNLESLRDALGRAELRMGAWEACMGRRYVVGVDGSRSANTALEAVIRMADRKDHIFVVFVRELVTGGPAAVSKKRGYSNTPYDHLLAEYSMWRAAADTVLLYAKDMAAKGIDYSLLIPSFFDARATLVRIASDYGANYLVIGKHRGVEKERLRRLRRIRSVKKFLREHAPKTTEVLVM